MASDHVNRELLAAVEGRLPGDRAQAVEAHLAGCAECREERASLREAAALFGRAIDVEPRPGFATRVALAAAEKQRPFAAPVWRWAFGGFATAAVAAAAVLVLLPRGAHDGGPSHEMLLAQRLDFYEELSVVQNRDALENLEVVEQLDQLPEVGKP